HDDQGMGAVSPGPRLGRSLQPGGHHAATERHHAAVGAAALQRKGVALPGSGPVLMSLSPFHPIVARWFAETLGEPTAAQRRGWPAIRARRHTLIAAPTGSGKTLAAFLTVLDDLFQEGLRRPLPDEVRVVYVSPLKA